MNVTTFHITPSLTDDVDRNTYAEAHGFTAYTDGWELCWTAPLTSSTTAEVLINPTENPDTWNVAIFDLINDNDSDVTVIHTNVPSFAEAVLIASHIASH